ncbi:hypothetical protein LENED_000545 [Lentinula edodes]|uniref:Uncharacterized protein n=1 Tax=Lentinula edodes TaxID=5353 RepID=A0A1Q3DVT2_LENED|nr:hypothetical protein LENED_000545 [Lentinula edodes]
MELYTVFWLLLIFWTRSAIAPVPSTSDVLQIHTIRTAYQELGSQVSRTLQIQLGDVSRIQRQQTSAEQFLDSVVRRQHLFDDEEFTTICTGIADMLSALAEATVQSEDIVEHAAFEPVQTFMEHQAESEETMALRILELHNTWRKTMVLSEDLTYGDEVFTIFGLNVCGGT